MSENEKCFCHLNGYMVKDAIARNSIDEINTNLPNKADKSNVDALSNKISTIESTLPNKADKTYVDNAISNIDIPEATVKGYYYMEIPLGIVSIGDDNYEYNEVDSSNFNEFSEFLNTINTNNVKNPKLIIANTTDSIESTDGTVVNNPIPRFIELGNLTKSVVDGKTLYNMQGICNSLRTYSDNKEVIASLTINGTETDDTYTIEHIFIHLKFSYVPTKEDIDNLIPIYTLNVSSQAGGYWYGSSGITLNSGELEQLKEIFNKGIDPIYIRVVFSDQGISKFKEYLLKLDYSNTTNKKYNCLSAINSGSIGIGLYSLYLSINGDISDGIFNVASAYLKNEVIGESIITKSKVITKDNISSYTPTGDYHPATKKYVDDSIADISTGGEVDLTNYYTKDEVDTSLSNKVDTSTYNTKVSELETAIGTKVSLDNYQTKIEQYNTAISSLDTRTSTLESNISNKLDTSTYESFISSYNNTIATLDTKAHSVLSGTSDPTSDLGDDGDIYIKYEE